MCNYCGKSSHLVDTCYKKHSFPPGYKLVNNKPKNVDLKDDGDNEEVRLTSKQYQALMALIKSGNDSNESNKNSQVSNISTNSMGQGNIFLNLYSSHSHNWILDSGATNHVCINLSMFSSHNRIKDLSVNLPNGLSVIATHKGIVQLHDDIILKDVLFIPDFKHNLIFVSKLIEKSQLQVVFSECGCFIQDQMTKRTIGSAKHQAGLYVFTCSKHNVNNMYISNLWHKRLGHPSDKRLEILRQRFDFINPKDMYCDICHMAKQRKLSFPNSDSYAANLFDLLHVDLWGPSPVISLHRHKYFLTIIDDHSRFTWVFLMKTRFEIREHLKNFISYVETQFDTKIKVIRSDNGFEFNMPSFFNSKGIIHQTTCVEIPEQNGIVERKHQHLLNVTRSLLFQTKLSKQFWSYTLINATFLINNIPTPILKNSTPYEKLHNKMYNISSLKVFGCLCFAQTLSAKRSKFDPRARADIFLGLSSHTKGYVIFDLKKHDIIIS